MGEREKKLKVLHRIARALNEEGALWALGGSLLLYFKGRVDDFHDIDIMAGEADIERVKRRLCALGELLPPKPKPGYKTRHFLEFIIDGVEVDVMAGFVIVKDGVDYDCSLRPEQVAEQISLKGERIPLQRLSDWRRYYELMGRPEKARLAAE